MAARSGFAAMQVGALAAGLLALALLVLLRTDLIASWRAATPPDAPNRFVINLMPEQADDFLKMLHGAGVKKQNMDFAPMFRGRLTHINGKPAALPEKTAKTRGEERRRAQRLLEREFNLSNMAAMPAHNQLAAGQWKNDEENAVSVEEGLAKTLGLKLGDELAFDIAGLEAKARITSLRRVDWASMHVNFFVIFPRAEMPEGESLPVTHIAAWHAPEHLPDFDNELVARLPNITLIDTSAIIAQVQRVLAKVAPLGVQTVCPLHGPMLRDTLDEVLRLYGIWSSYGVETPGVFVAYASIHGGTAEVALKLADMLREKGCPKVAVCDLTRDDRAEAVEDAFRYGTLVLAAASYDAGLFTPAYDFLHSLQMKGWQKRRVALIENGSWAPSAGRVMKEMLGAMKEVEQVGELVTIRSRYKAEDQAALEALANAILA